MLEIEKIDNINYTLKLKYNQFFIYLILLIVIVLYCLINFNKKIRELLTCNNITRLDWGIFIFISIFCFYLLINFMICDIQLHHRLHI